MQGLSASTAARRAPAVLILLLACLAGTWAVAARPPLGTAPVEPPGQSLAGSYVVFDPSMGGDTGYIPGTTGNFCFRAESYTNDYEYVYDVWLRFPTGWVVNSVSVVGTPTCDNGSWGSFSWYYETAGVYNEIDIYHSRYQSTTDHCVAYYMVNATPAAGGNAQVSWYWDGDGYAAAPHHPCSSDNYTPPSMSAYPCDQMVNPPAVVPILADGIYFAPDALAVSGCPGEPQTHTLNLFNNSGAAGTFNLSYDVTTANGVLTGPASVTADDGETVPFDVSLTPGSGTVDGEIVTAVVTASGGGYTGTATITKTVIEAAWNDIATEPNAGRMDNVVAGYAGLIWSITGYNNDYPADVRTYNPVANAWTTVTGSTPPFGYNYARSGAVWGNKVYLYGDSTTAGFTGLWSYNMDTNTWTNESPSGTAPAYTGIWAPAWVADPATGLLYITGGATAPGGGNLTTVYVYDPVANAWQAPLPSFTSVRDFHAAFIFTRPSDGHKLLCVAGGTNVEVDLDSTQCYDFTTGTWGAENADVPAIPFTCMGMGYAQTLSAGGTPQLWVVGGYQDDVISTGAYFYDVNAGAWVDGGPYTGSACFRTSAAVLDNEIYKLGGSTGSFSHTGLASRRITCGGAPVCLLSCSATATPDSGVAPLEVTFTSTVDAQDCADPIEYWWDFGDGETSADANPVHTYYGAGWYEWTLTVTSGMTECATSGWVYVDPFDMSFYDDAGRAQLCANSVTGYFMWFLYTGPYKGYYVSGYGLTGETPEMWTLSSPPWATSWSLLFRYYPEQHRAAGTLYLRGYQLTSGISDHNTTNNPDGCNSIF